MGSSAGSKSLVRLRDVRERVIAGNRRSRIFFLHPLVSIEGGRALRPGTR